MYWRVELEPGITLPPVLSKNCTTQTRPKPENLRLAQNLKYILENRTLGVALTQTWYLLYSKVQLTVSMYLTNSTVRKGRVISKGNTIWMFWIRRKIMKGMVGIFDSQILCFSDSSQIPTRNLRSLQIYSKTRISTVEYSIFDERHILGNLLFFSQNCNCYRCLLRRPMWHLKVSYRKKNISVAV